MLKHYVELNSDVEDSVREVESRDPSKIQVPADCDSFYFFDREEVEVNGEILRGKRKNCSVGYSVGGRIMSLEDVKRDMPDAETLIWNLSEGGWDRVVKTRFGYFRPCSIEDVVVPER